MNASQRLLKGTGLCLFSALAWGAQFPVAGLVLERVHPFYFTLIRYGVATLLFAVLLLATEGAGSFKLQGQGLALWMFGTLAFTGYNFLVFLGQRMAGPAGPVLTSVMMAFMPLVTAIVVWLWKKHRPPAFTLLCIVGGLLGVLLVATKGEFERFLSAEGNGPAALLVIAGVFCWVVYTLGGSHFPGGSSLRYTTLTCVLGTGSSLIIVAACTWSGAIKAPSWADLQASAGPLAYMAVVAGFLAVLSWNEANRMIAPINAMLFSNLVTVVSVTISVLWGYRLSAIETAGVALTISALLLNNLYQRKTAVPSARVRGSAGAAD